MYGQQEYTLTVEIKGVNGNNGNLLLGIYDKKEGAFEVKNKFDGVIVPAKKGTMICFDRAYNDYTQYAKWTEEGMFFVGRLKSNALYEV